MAKPTIAAIADAFVVAVNAHSFSQEFTAARLWAPRFEVADLATLQVSVCPRSRDTSFADRKSNTNLHVIDVAFQVQLQGADEPAREVEIDTWAYLVEEVADWAARLSLTVSAVRVPCVGAQTSPLVAIDYDNELAVFQSALSLTFREGRYVG